MKHVYKWISKQVNETQYFLVKVSSGASDAAIVRAFEESDANGSDPDETKTHSCDLTVDHGLPDALEVKAHRGGTDLTQETT